MAGDNESSLKGALRLEFLLRGNFQIARFFPHYQVDLFFWEVGDLGHGENDNDDQWLGADGNDENWKHVASSDLQGLFHPVEV